MKVLKYGFVFFLVFFIFFSTQSIYASYIDPGTGSYIIQILIAVVAGSLLILKIGWKRIKAYFQKLFSKEEQKEKKS